MILTKSLFGKTGQEHLGIRATSHSLLVHILELPTHQRATPVLHCFALLVQRSREAQGQVVAARLQAHDSPGLPIVQLQPGVTELLQPRLCQAPIFVGGGHIDGANPEDL
jgi:hypothetical protein